MSKYFLFLDTKTTGLDPKTDSLLEVAWFITDEHLVSLSQRQTYPVHVDEGHTLASLSMMNDYVRDMHTTSGLLNDIEDGATLDYIFRELAADIDTYVGPDDTLHITGLSIHFDVDFLKANDFGSLFEDFGNRKAKIHHRHLDLSSVKLMIDAAGLTKAIIQDVNPYPHRALFDCLDALAYARRTRNYLREAFPFPPVEVKDIEVITGPTITVVEGSDIL